VLGVDRQRPVHVGPFGGQGLRRRGHAQTQLVDILGRRRGPLARGFFAQGQLAGPRQRLTELEPLLQPAGPVGSLGRRSIAQTGVIEGAGGGDAKFRRLGGRLQGLDTRIACQDGRYQVCWSKLLDMTERVVVVIRRRRGAS
jgi:hypothetical protein